MKHVVFTRGFVFGTNPFPAFRAELVFGRNKRDREFLPVTGVSPVTVYKVTDASGDVLYEGTDKLAAERAKEGYEADPGVKAEWGPLGHATIEASAPALPEGGFRVIKTREGSILIVSGEDKSNRCLLFVGCNGGFRGGVSVIKDGTTATILKVAAAGNACASSVELIALMEEGQTVAFHSSGRHTDEVFIYTWDGSHVEKKHFSKAEWDSRTAVTAVPEDAEVL